MFKNIYKCTSYVSSPTTSPLRRSTEVLYRCDQVDEVFQEDELPSSFDIDSAPALDSLGGDLNDIILPQKRKREQKRRNNTRSSSRRKQIDPDSDDN
jgi:hypothetical protein